MNSACGVCEGKRLKPLFRLDSPCLMSDSELVDISVKKDFCCDCGVVLTDPSDRAAMSARYSEEYALASREISGEVKGYDSGVETSRSLLAAAWIKSLLVASQIRLQGLSVLEIGSGTGTLAGVLENKFGSSVVCVEPNKTAREACHSRGIQCKASLEEVTDTFDLVIFFTSLEHIENPREYIRNTKNLIKNDGHILIVVPESKDRSYDYFYGDHLYHFSARSLEYMMGLESFRQIITESGSRWARGVFASVFQPSRLQHNLPHLEASDEIMVRVDKWFWLFQQLEKDLRSSLTSGRRLVVFGAGQFYIFLSRYVPILLQPYLIVDDNKSRYPNSVTQADYVSTSADVVILLFTPRPEVLLKLEAVPMVFDFWSDYDQIL